LHLLILAGLLLAVNSAVMTAFIIDHLSQCWSEYMMPDCTDITNKAELMMVTAHVYTHLYFLFTEK